MLTIKSKDDPDQGGNQRLQKILDSLYAFVGLLSVEGMLLEANRAPLEVAGLRREDVIGQPFWETYWWSFSPEVQQRLQAVIHRAAQGSCERYDTPVRIENGQFIMVDFSLRPVFDDSGRITQLVASGVDITERKHAEATLRESEERFRQVVENIREVFWMTDMETKKVLYVSSGYEQIWGRSRQEVYQSPGVWTEAIHPEDRERVLAAVAIKLESGKYNEEYRIIRPDGSVRWILDRGFPVEGESEGAHRIVGIAEDITERKEIEEKFLRAQRIESIGSLASGVAHDLNNILSPIMMCSTLLREGLSREETERLINTVESCAHRGAGLVRQLLAFGRGVQGQRSVMQPDQLMKEMAKLVGETFSKTIELNFQTPADLWPVNADATQLHQVLLNLCVNARDAMPHGGRLTISAKNVLLDEQHAGLIPNAQPGRYVMMNVTDTGHGIPREIQDKIFDPFFTTKGPDKGTGLGLATVLGIVRSHGGFVEVRSELGKGSTFSIYLPAAMVKESAPGKSLAHQAPMGQGELILVVDDEAPILKVTQQMLERNGYRAAVAEGGAAAMIFLTGHKAEVQAIVTDLEMPSMDGVSLARAVKKMTPDLPIVACTGIGSAKQLRAKTMALNEAGVQIILNKPIMSMNLLDALGAALRRK